MMMSPIKMQPGDIDRIDVGDLLRVIAVIERGSITKTARALNTTQPTLTRRIRRLERALGRQILRRSASGVELTSFGRDIIAQAEVIAAAVGSILRLSGGNAAPMEIRVGATPLPALQILPEAMKSMARLRPNLAVRVTEGVCPALLTQLRNGELDLVLASPSVEGPERDVTFKRLFFAHLCVIASSKNPIAARKGVQLSDLGCMTWALPGRDSTFRGRIEHELARQGLTLPANTIEMPSPSSLLRFIAVSDAVTALPEEMVCDNLRSGGLARIDGGWRFSSYPYGIFVRRSDPLRSRLRSFARIVEQAVHTLGLAPD